MQGIVQLCPSMLLLCIDPTNLQLESENVPSGHPVWSTYGYGGQWAQLQKMADIVGVQLLSKVTGQKCARNLADTMLDRVPDNAMAPPAVAKHQCVSPLIEYSTKLNQ